MKTKYLTKSQEFDGLPKVEDFKCVEENIDDSIGDGEILTEALVVSVDPYIRIFPNPVGSPIGAFQVAKVLKSNVKEYPVNSVVMYHGGWKTINKAKKEEIWYRVDELLSKENYTQAVGVLGMTGLTAYLAFLDICKPKEGETVMVNASSGAVGSVVGQIAKIKGCRVVGCCGSNEKIAFCKKIGYDDLFNYKTESWPEAIKKVAPNGIDCFFDNVGGQLASETIAQMNTFGRCCVIGSISAYNQGKKVQADILQDSIVAKQLEIKGFIMFNPAHQKQIPAALKDLAQWMKEGKLINRETIYDGFENIPKAFIEQISGKTTGKAAVRV